MSSIIGRIALRYWRWKYQSRYISRLLEAQSSTAIDKRTTYPSRETAAIQHRKN